MDFVIWAACGLEFGGKQLTRVSCQGLQNGKKALGSLSLHKVLKKVDFFDAKKIVSINLQRVIFYTSNSCLGCSFLARCSMKIGEPLHRFVWYNWKNLSSQTIGSVAQNSFNGAVHFRGLIRVRVKTRGSNALLQSAKISRHSQGAVDLSDHARQKRQMPRTHSFSTLRHLKLWILSSITEDRLSGLAMLLIHRGTDFTSTPWRDSMTLSQIGNLVPRAFSLA